MQVVILSRGEGIHTTRRLVEATRQLGHRARVVDPGEVQLGLLGSGPKLFLRDKPLPKCDVVIPRIAQSISTYAMAVVNQFEIGGAAVLNSAVAIAQSRNKMRLMQLLAQHDLPVPPTIVGRGALELKRMVDAVGGLPVAIRIVGGPDRYGIIVCETAQSMEAALETVLSMGHNIIVQRYVEPGAGRDLRALVVGGAVVAAVRRRPRAGRVRHSLSTGAQITKARLTAAQRALAVNVARVVGLDVCAVDMLETKGDGTRVFEVHASPGLRELEEASGEDLALPIVKRALELAKERQAATARRTRARGNR